MMKREPVLFHEAECVRKVIVSMSEKVSINDGPTTVITRKRGGKTDRLSNMELLRCIAMMMIVVLHYLGKGNILADLSGQDNPVYSMVAWIIECICIVAVNVYMLISGYFSRTSSFRLSRLVKLYLQVWVYSVLIGFLAYFVGIYPADEFSFHYILTLIFPITMGHYWFMTAYVFMYVLMPLFGMAIRNMNKKQMQVTIVILLILNCVLKSVTPARLEMDGQGYDFMWYLCVFLIAAYIGRFGYRVTHWIQGATIYALGVILTFSELMILHAIYVRTGSLEHIMKISIEYNHIFPLIASVGLFLMFLNINIKGKIAHVINRIAPYTLGVYLLHENFAVRYEWQKWMGAGRIDSISGLIINTIVAVAVVFTAGIIVDAIRALLMQGLHRVLLHVGAYRYLVEKIDGIDRLFSIKEEDRL